MVTIAAQVVLLRAALVTTWLATTTMVTVAVRPLRHTCVVVLTTVPSTPLPLTMTVAPAARSMVDRMATSVRLGMKIISPSAAILTRVTAVVRLRHHMCVVVPTTVPGTPLPVMTIAAPAVRNMVDRVVTLVRAAVTVSNMPGMKEAVDRHPVMTIIALPTVVAMIIVATVVVRRVGMTITIVDRNIMVSALSTDHSTPIVARIATIIAVARDTISEVRNTAMLHLVLPRSGLVE